MKSIVTGKQMQLLDKNTAEHFGVPSGILMEQASLAFVQELFLSDHIVIGRTKILVIAGTGNNGGDGIAIARLLNQRGAVTDLYALEDLLQQEAHTSKLHDLQLTIYKNYEYPLLCSLNEIRDSYDIVIDALFGVGLARDLSGFYPGLIEIMNRLSGYKIAVDIPSGVCADTGCVRGIAFEADATYTFSFGKLGMYLWPGSEKCGRIHILSIGITQESFLGEKAKVMQIEADDLKNLLPGRSAHSNKGSYGRLLIIGGSRNMAGAAIFAAEAAYRCGCGLVRIYTPEENRTIIQERIPEALLDTYHDTVNAEQLEKLLHWADAVVMGPGMGTSELAARILKGVCRNITKPLLLDADALNICSLNPDILLQIRTPVIITPHLGEMARLTGKSVSVIQSDLLHTAQSFAEDYDVYCVLKDFHTIIAEPGGEEIYLNLSGNNGLATGGSGDILSGIIGSLLVQGSAPMQAAAAGVYVHGLAADLMKEKTGCRGMIARDVIEGLKEVWKQTEQ